jgi:hypothetical protein
MDEVVPGNDRLSERVGGVWWRRSERRRRIDLMVKGRFFAKENAEFK